MSPRCKNDNKRLEALEFLSRRYCLQLESSKTSSKVEVYLVEKTENLCVDVFTMLYDDAKMLADAFNGEDNAKDPQKIKK